MDDALKKLSAAVLAAILLATALPTPLKNASKIQKGMTWPKYWSACNKRLRATGE
jgi:hypothetical protein